MTSQKRRLCRMTLYHSLNIHSLILVLIILIQVIIVTNGYSCDEGTPHFPTCNCTGNTANCNSTVEFEKNIELHCCLNTTLRAIYWYKEIISNESLIGYNETTSTNYTTNATGIDEYFIHTDKFQFSDGGKKLTIRETQSSHAGIYICSVGHGQQPFSQKLDVQGASSVNPSLEQTLEHDCPKEVKVHTSDKATLCCSFQSESRLESITIQWFANNDTTLPLYTDHNHNIVSDCKERQDETQVYTTIKTSLKLNVKQSSYGYYTANVSILTYGKRKHISKQCDVTLVEKEIHVSRQPLGERVYISVIVSIFVCALLICVIALIWIYHRYNVSITLLYSYHCQPLKDDFENKQYDAFIAYSTADEDTNFVIGSLLPFFERNNLSVCVRDINFFPGGERFHDSTAAVEASRRTILILSPEFISSPHCKYEFEVALCNMIDLGKGHKIIPILLRKMQKSHMKEFKQLERVLFIVKELRWVEEKPDVFHKMLLKRMPSSSTVFKNEDSQRFCKQSINLSEVV